eukprot:TRINITY_DN771_c0_g1_i1.p1 TRINITY_DN771_c0_g1~~TRINITY_DN771_c0_g1_i1.p1  ORF type:complete len:449 (+),score=134.19 TRINITY_DN771_c0_g1_i1:50-1396(+)
MNLNAKMNYAWSWPELNKEEIVECLNQLNLSIEIEDLIKPSYEKMKIVYESMSQFLTAICNQELYQQNQFTSTFIDFFEFPELHSDSISELLFIKNTSILMKAAGIQDFCPRIDIYYPTCTRTMRNLSAIINFAKFREEKLTSYQQIVSQSDTLIETKNQLQQQHLQLQTTLNNLKLEREQQEPKIKFIIDNTKELENEIIELNKKQMVLQNESKQHKQILSELQNKITQEQYIINNTKQDLTRIKSRIVHAPEQTKKMLEEMSNNLENEKQSMIDCENRYTTQMSAIGRLERVQNVLQKTISLIDQCENEQQKSKKHNSNINNLTINLKQSEEKLQELENKISITQRQINSQQVKFDKLNKQLDQSKQQNQQTIVQSQIEVKRFENEQLSLQQSLDQNSILIKHKQQFIDRLLKEHENDMNVLKNEYQLLQDQLHIYHNKLLTSIRT